LGSNGDLTPSDVSTPTLPPEPFEPRFKVKVTDAVKNGDVLTYTVKTTEVCFVIVLIYSLYSLYLLQVWVCMHIHILFDLFKLNQ